MGDGMRKYLSFFIFLLIALNLFLMYIHMDRVDADVRTYDLTNAITLLNTTYSEVVSLPGQRLFGVVKPASWIIPSELAPWCYVDKDICFVYTIRNRFYIFAVSKAYPRQISTVYSLDLNTLLPSGYAISDTIVSSYIITTPFRDENNRTIYALVILGATVTGAMNRFAPTYSGGAGYVRDLTFRFIPFVFDNSIRFITSMIAAYKDTRSVVYYTIVTNDGRGGSVVFLSLISAAVNEYGDLVIKYVAMTAGYDPRLGGSCPDATYCQSVSFIFDAAIVSQINSSSVFITVNPRPRDVNLLTRGGY